MSSSTDCEVAINFNGVGWQPPPPIINKDTGEQQLVHPAIPDAKVGREAQDAPAIAVFDNQVFVLAHPPNGGFSAHSGTLGADEKYTWTKLSGLEGEHVITGGATAVVHRGELWAFLIQGSKLCYTKYKSATKSFDASPTELADLDHWTSSPGEPVAISYNDKIWIFFSGADRGICYATWSGGTTQSGPVGCDLDWIGPDEKNKRAGPYADDRRTEKKQRSQEAVGVTVYHDRLYLAHRDTYEGNTLLLTSYKDGGWANPVVVSADASSAPSLTVFNGFLYITYQGLDEYMWHRIIDGIGIGPEIQSCPSTGAIGGRPSTAAHAAANTIITVYPKQ